MNFIFRTVVALETINILLLTMAAENLFGIMQKAKHKISVVGFQEIF